MTPIWRCWWWKLRLASWLAMGGAIAVLGDYALAQITPDGTLGSESSTVTSTGSVDQIDGGATRGANLFHSFREFSVPTGGAAYFNNALDIQNIISRVTGGSISNIDGLIAANGTANLFLLNPNGIIFGPNATLAIGGSFLGSTASSLNFADGTNFSATAPQTTPLLTVSVPLGLQYGSNPGRVQVQGSGLRVQTDQTLALVGGDVSVEGGESGFLSAPGGRIELGGLAVGGIVEIEGQQSEGAFGLSSLSFPASVERADVLLTNNAYVNVAASGGGSIAINARNIDISGESILRGGLETNSGFLGATAGDITLNATGAIAIANSNIFNNVRTGAVGNGGDINIKTGSLDVRNGAQLNASTRGKGDAGRVTIHARDTVSFDGVGSNKNSSAVYSTVEPLTGMGNGGGINITTGSLSLTNGAGLSTSSAGSGAAGDIEVVTARSIRVENQAFLRSDTTAGQGNILLRSQDLVLRSGSGITANATGTATGGNITIDTGVIVALEDSDISANALAGPGGRIIIDAQGIFGTEFRNQQTPESDITATSDLGTEFSGTVNISRPNVDRNLQVIVLSTGRVVVSSTPLIEVAGGLIATGCAALGENKFIVTGRGGLPENPTDTLSSDAVEVDLVTLNPREENRKESKCFHQSN